MGLTVLEEGLEQLDQIVGVGDVLVQSLASAFLVKDGTLGTLEDDVVARIAEVELLSDFFFEIVLAVLGLPVAVLQGEGVKHRTVENDGLVIGEVDAKFVYEFPLKVPRALVKQRGERLPDSAFMADIELSELMQRVVVVLEPGGGRLKIQRHRGLAGRQCSILAFAFTLRCATRWPTAVMKGILSCFPRASALG